MKTILAVASGSTAQGVPWYVHPSWSIQRCLPNSSWTVLHGTPFSRSVNSLGGLTWYLSGSKGLGDKPLTTMPSCAMWIVPLCQTSMSKIFVMTFPNANQLAEQRPCPCCAACVPQVCTHMTAIVSPDELVSEVFGLLSWAFWTILSAMPLDEGWWAGENERITFFSKERSSSLWLLKISSTICLYAGDSGASDLVQVCGSLHSVSASLITAKPLVASFFVGMGTKMGICLDIFSISAVTAATGQCLWPSADGSNPARFKCMTPVCRSPFCANGQLCSPILQYKPGRSCPSPNVRIDDVLATLDWPVPCSFLVVKLLSGPSLATWRVIIWGYYLGQVCF